MPTPGLLFTIHLKRMSGSIVYLATYYFHTKFYTPYSSYRSVASKRPIIFIRSHIPHILTISNHRSLPVKTSTCHLSYGTFALASGRLDHFAFYNFHNSPLHRLMWVSTGWLDMAALVLCLFNMTMRVYPTQYCVRTH
jgi:hypothetical protein